ncbi:MAG: quinone-dependent dihydroorotate dehydrogenase [Verrucomicrobiota bacterium]|nr:quinone-dependent dihydroorotate dehydrogenase [Verrucomicrobiota bacterium]
MIYKSLVRPAFFRLDPEMAHELASDFMGILENNPLAKLLLGKFLIVDDAPVKTLGLKFPNVVGLAAGFDKDGRFPAICRSIGFGHMEVGTVTPRGQAGNPKPRLFRIPKEEALINSMGFNNDGAYALCQRIRNSYPKGKNRSSPLGINIGKNKDTPLELAFEDYVSSFNIVAEQADYVTVNISSPNTPDLRKLQDNVFLDELLSEIGNARNTFAKRKKLSPIPIMLKISPDEKFKSIERIVSCAINHGFNGVVAANTSLRKKASGLASDYPKGGLSGKPLIHKTLKLVRFISLLTDKSVPIIGVGGVTNVESAGRILDAGATLIQIYTSFIYQGPFFPSRLAKHLIHKKEWF